MKKLKSKLKKNKKGFTLIELLAVVVIIAILMILAIPAVETITINSRRKTLVEIIDSFATTTKYNITNGQFDLADKENAIYAIPIECIELEKGGASPFGEWLQACERYWAYVLVQYDRSKEKYIYGFTFKDSAGYGVYPTDIENIKRNKSIIQFGLNLRKPETGSYVNIAEKENWTGFKIQDDTKLIVLEASKYGDAGDMINTCTLCTKGENYDELSDENSDKLLYNIVKDSVSLGKGKQYFGKGFNDGPKNIYFYDDAGSNNVLFADYCWKVIRTTGTGGIKLIYNGEPSEAGTCNNAGSDTQIGRTQFNEYSSALSDVGYMNGAAWDPERIDVSNPYYQTILNVQWLYRYNFRYYTNITYSGGTYSLSGSARLGYWYNIWDRVEGYYTCQNQYSTCTTAYYVVKSLNDSNAILYKLQNGNIISESPKITLAPDVTINPDGSYTLKDYVTIDHYTYYQNYSNYKNYYFCPDKVSTTCETVKYITNPGTSYVYAADLGTNLYGSSYEYKNGKYTLKDTKLIKNAYLEGLGNRHYTCLNTTGECEVLNFIYSYKQDNAYSLLLEDGLPVEEAIEYMLTINDEDSIVKTVLDEWYEDNMIGYTNKLEDTVFCNNREITTMGGWDPNGTQLDTDLKFYEFDNTDLSCDNLSDRFTVSQANGNGKLKYPVGLITASEAKLWNSRASGAKYWTMTAFGYGREAAHVYQVFEDGLVNFDRVTFSNSVRPVVSLKPGTLITDGDGSTDNPYKVD